MILSREQINRYMRHIIMPDISGPGQKKLLETNMLVLSESAEVSQVLLLYLAASGIGRIDCCFTHNSGCEKVFEAVRDLNPDVQISSLNCADLSDAPHICIILGNAGYTDLMSKTIQSQGQKYPMPVIAAVTGNWSGVLQTMQSACSPNPDFNTFGNPTEGTVYGRHTAPPGLILSRSVLGALAAVEAVKVRLSIGKVLEKPLYFDLWNSSFTQENENNKLEAPCLKDFDSVSTYNKLKASKVLIVGCGGLGSPAALGLAASGIGTIGLIDYDTVDISNLNRQIMHSTSRLGIPKTKSAEVFLKGINPAIKPVLYNEALTRENALDIIRDYDLVIDGLDNLPARYLLNDACYFAEKPFIEAGVLAFHGLLTVVSPVEGHCYRCIFPEIPENGSVPSCSETGVLGPVPGVMGFMQAAEALKLLTENPSRLKDSILIFDSLAMEFDLVESYKNANCELCGENPAIKELQDYSFVCNDKKE